MAIDTYSTTKLAKVVSILKRPAAGFLQMAFNNIIVSDTTDIKFDVVKGKRRISPFVHPLVEGKIVEDLGYETKTFTPAYVKDKRVFDPQKPLKRIAGETIGGALSRADRAAANLNVTLADQQAMLVRRQEVMASEVMRTGKVTITGKGYDSVVVDFGRNSAHTSALAGGARWGQAGVSPLSNVEDWATTMLRNSSEGLGDIVFDTKAWRLFVADEKAKDAININYGVVSALEIAAYAKLGMIYKGDIDGVRHWIYSDWYVNDAGNEVPMMPDNTVVLVGSEKEGTRYYGAILDNDTAVPMEIFTKSWTVEDPSSRVIMMQTAPLVVPDNVDASFCVTVA